MFKVRTVGNHKHEMSLKAKSYIGTMNGTKENLFWYVNVANPVHESKLKMTNVFDPVDSLAGGFDPQVRFESQQLTVMSWATDTY